MRTTTATWLKALLALLLLAAVAGQVYLVLVVVAFSSGANASVAWPVTPLTVLGILFLVCVEFAFVATWALLTMAGQDAIFTARAFGWVDVIIWATVIACVLDAGMGILLFAMWGWQAWVMVLTWLVTLAVGIALALLVGVMRSLLHKATELQQDLAEVV